MESIFSRAHAWVGAISPRVVLAAKLAFALLAICIVGTMVDWRTVVTDLNGLFFPIMGGIALMVPALMATALRWKLLIGTETPRRFSFLTALRGFCLGLFINLVMPGMVGGDVGEPITQAFALKSNIRSPFLSCLPSGSSASSVFVSWAASAWY